MDELLHITKRLELLSLTFVKAIAIKAGFKVDEPSVDNDSIDVQILARGKLTPNSVLSSPMIGAQVKATTTVDFNSLGNSFPFKLSRKNYTDLIQERFMPAFLFVMLVPEDIHTAIDHTDTELILRHSIFWHDLLGMPALPSNQAHKTIQINTSNRLTVDTLYQLLLAAEQKRVS